MRTLSELRAISDYPYYAHETSGIIAATVLLHVSKRIHLVENVCSALYCSMFRNPVNKIHSLELPFKGRLIMPANHPSNILGCRSLVVTGRGITYYQPLEPISVEACNNIRR